MLRSLRLGHPSIWSASRLTAFAVLGLLLVVAATSVDAARRSSRCKRSKRKEARTLVKAGDLIFRRLRCKGRKYVSYLYDNALEACYNPAILLRMADFHRRCVRGPSGCIKARGYFGRWFRHLRSRPRLKRAYRRKIKFYRKWILKHCPRGNEPRSGAIKRLGQDRSVMAFVPSGWYARGAASASPDARPARKVYLGGFWIDVTEVSNSAYANCVSAGVCRAAEWLDPNSPRYIGKSGESAIYSGFMGDMQPAVGVAWPDARKYCTWAGKRLPTEAEWEAAARGPGGRAFPWGNKPPTCKLANFYSGYPGCGKARTAKVDSQAAGASPFGVRHLAGNVLEWVLDCHSRLFYANGPELNPVNLGKGRCRRVRRGGAWLTRADGLQAFDRSASRQVYRSNTTGFRCVKPLRGTKLR